MEDITYRESIKIIAAMLLVALRDASGKDKILASEALEWLEVDGIELANRAGLYGNKIVQWINGGCKPFKSNLRRGLIPKEEFD